MTRRTFAELMDALEKEWEQLPPLGRPGLYVFFAERFHEIGYIELEDA